MRSNNVSTITKDPSEIKGMRYMTFLNTLAQKYKVTSGWQGHFNEKALDTLPKIKSAIKSAPEFEATAFRQRVEAKYDIKEAIKTVIDWSKKLLGGIIATAIFTNAAFGVTLKNPDDVAKQLEKSVKGGGYSIQVVDDTHGNEKMGGTDHPYQKVTFKMVKDGKTVGTATYKSLDTDKLAGGLGREDVRNPGVSISTSGTEDGQSAKDAHIALLTLQLGLEKKGDIGDPDGTEQTLKKVMEHKASDYSKRGYEPIAKHLLDKKVVEKTKTVDKPTKTPDKSAKTLDKLAKTGKDLGKDLTKTAKNVGKEVSKDAKKAWESGKSFLNKLANK